MAGMVEWKTQISLDIEDLKKRVKIAEGELIGFPINKEKLS